MTSLVFKKYASHYLSPELPILNSPNSELKLQYLHLSPSPLFKIARRNASHSTEPVSGSPGNNIEKSTGYIKKYPVLLSLSLERHTLVFSPSSFMLLSSTAFSGLLLPRVAFISSLHRCLRHTFLSRHTLMILSSTAFSDLLLPRVAFVSLVLSLIHI